MELKRFLLYSMIALPLCLWSWDFGSEVVTFRLGANAKDGMIIYMNIKQGYGVQKKAENYLALYESKTYVTSKKEIKKLVQSGKARKLAEIKKLYGVTAKQDPHYFSKLYPWKTRAKLRKLNRQYLVGRIYFCSFQDKFCSVQSVAKVF
ncbi:MAG: hypothetical protein D6767_09315 [Candidatus Hydrogenedentota bacterium]|nr:MAG: hypothetical protein D6767_09315 [Candidatus Hydrogenedentota bacterium]